MQKCYVQQILCIFYCSSRYFSIFLNFLFGNSQCQIILNLLINPQQGLFHKGNIQHTMGFIKILLHISILLTSLALDTSQSNIIKLAIISTNDLHGAAFPKQFYQHFQGKSFKYGGLVYLAALMKIVQQEYGDKAIYLDSGDQFQGAIESGPKVSKGEIIADFFNELNVKASTIGNHQFDFSQQFLFNYLNMKNSINLAANLFSEKGQPHFLPKHKSSQIFNMNGIKLGVIGLATTQTPTTTFGFISQKFPKYQFRQYPQITIRQAATLREEGAQIILVLAHFGEKCPKNKTYDIRNNKTQQQPCHYDQVIKFIDELPEGTIDGIITGHRHQFVHHWYKNIPFMGSIDGGYYFNILYFYFDLQTRKIVGSQIEGPIPVCEKIFQNTGDCQFYPLNKLQKIGPLVQWQFHGKKVKADQNMQRIFKKYEEKMESYNRAIADNEMFLYVKKKEQYPLANIITSLMTKAGRQKGHQVHFSVINNGSFRTKWYPGVIQMQHFFNMFPFQNNLVLFSIKGIQLIELVRRIQSGVEAFYTFEGLIQTFVSKRVFSEASKQFKIEKRLQRVSMKDGSQIEQQMVYNGITTNFLLEGGDDFSRVVRSYRDRAQNIYYNKLNLTVIEQIGEMRQLLENQLGELKIIKEEVWAITEEKRRIIIIQE